MRAPNGEADFKVNLAFGFRPEAAIRSESPKRLEISRSLNFANNHAVHRPTQRSKQANCDHEVSATVNVVNIMP